MASEIHFRSRAVTNPVIPPPDMDKILKGLGLLPILLRLLLVESSSTTIHMRLYKGHQDGLDRHRHPPSFPQPAVPRPSHRETLETQPYPIMTH